MVTRVLAYSVKRTGAQDILSFATGWDKGAVGTEVASWPQISQQELICPPGILQKTHFATYAIRGAPALQDHAGVEDRWGGLI